MCDGLTEDKIDALLRKWLARLPHPFSPADRAAGYRYDISILQAEFPLTQMLDKPISGRIFFEQVIRNNLDIGRPDQVALIFDRKLIRRGPHATPGQFRTRVITEGVTPSLHVDYKHTRIKQYHKEGRALRTETTINDSTDFRIGKRLTNLPALREIGSTANRRLLRVQSISHDPITGTDALRAITTPITTTTGARIPALRLGAQRSHALLAALPLFQLQPNGFANKDLRTLTAELRAVPAEQVTAGQMTYDLRRLRARGLITRIPHTHSHAITQTRLHTPPDTPPPSPAYPPRCSSPLCPTDSCRQAWRPSPTTPPHHPCTQLPAHTEPPSKTSATQPDSPHNTTNEQHNTKLDSKIRLRRIKPS